MSPREWIHAVGNGAFIGVMVFILAVIAASVLFAQCCVGDRGFMRTGYDFEGYVIRKCPVCLGTGLPRRTHPHVDETGPLEVEIQIAEEVRASDPSPPPPPPPSTSAPTAVAAATVATVAVAVPAAVKAEETNDANKDLEEEEEEEEEQEEEDDDEEEFLFDEEEML